MTQFVRPALDDSIGSWSNENDLTTNLHASIDEAVASTTDYVKSGTGPGDDIYRVKCDTGHTDPEVTTGYKVAYEYAKEGDDAKNALVQLVEGANSFIAAWSHLDVSTTPTEVTQTLTSTEANRIVDHNNLYLEFKSLTTGAWEDLGQNTEIAASGDAEAVIISSLEYFNGRLYLAYGDYDTNKPDGGSKILYWDTNTEAYVDSGVTAPGYGLDLALIDDELWVLSNDEAVGTHMSYTTVAPDHTITIRNFGSQIMGFHIFDAYFANGKPFLCGSAYGDGGDSDGAVWRYDAPNWVLAVSNTTISPTTGYRIYTILESGGYLWAKSHSATTYRSSDGGETWSSFGIALGAQTAKSISLPTGYALYRNTHWPPANDSSIFRLNGAAGSVSTVFNAFDGNGIANKDLYKSSDGIPYAVMDDGTIREGSRDGLTWAIIDDNAPLTATSLCVTDDAIYVGTSDSHLWRRPR